MKIALLFWRMLRYRVAVMLVIFLLIPLALESRLISLDFKIALAVVSLICSYVAATSFNDLADREIDKINHPGNKSRPLVSGFATERDLKFLGLLSAAITITSAALISSAAVGLLILSVLINVAYSVSPFRVSYRTYFAPIFLSVAYVGIPFCLGLAIADFNVTKDVVLLGGGLLFLFLGRINLKDFRDRKGDSKIGKPTLLLRFGKKVTCMVSAIAISVGALLVGLALPRIWWLEIIVAIYGISILVMLRNLYIAEEGPAEQLAIGVGAKLGNGLLLTILGFYVLESYHAEAIVSLVSVVVILGISFANLLFLREDPKTIILSYRG